MKKKYSRKKIIDQFTGAIGLNGRPVSRQRLWQLRRRSEGKCIICSKRAVNKTYCEHHRIHFLELSNTKRNGGKAISNGHSRTNARNGAGNRTAGQRRRKASRV